MPARPLTILQVTLSGNTSGGTRQALMLCRGLQEAGHRILFCGKEESWILRSAAEAGIETRALRARGLWGKWKASRLLRRLAADAGADVVHTHHTHAHDVALLSTVGGGFPPVVANRGVLFRPKHSMKYGTGRTAAVITNSEAVKGVLGGCGVPPAKVHVVYNARGPVAPAAPERVLALRREFDLEGQGPVIGAVGRARPEKGFQFLLDAAPGILERFPKAVFVLVGTGSPGFLPRVQSLGLADRFRLSGNRRDAVDIMGLFDLYVLPSIDMESCPNVLLEAMAVGLPVVGSRIGGVGEVLVDGETGLLVEPGNFQAIVSASTALLSDPDRAREMGAKGRERVASRFSLAAKVENTLRVYHAVLAARR